ncbi:DUF1512 domain-containing protein [Candidatus Bathyarchaeota archaeon]|nr:DUF1512 domain-containing protein [Candidatus Bathyarchaeota archaeon]NIV43475.1 DUF1512 domain-containing protein [Candidatus Bathyarchaeota archaeon]UCC28649.1 MAG: DUF1512 domain-containing protein [Candidatus Bathyarchaeota archaeon]
MFYGQRIQIYIIIREIQGSMMRLKFMRDEGRKMAIKTVKELGKPSTEPAQRVDQFLEYFAISPVNLDPAGIIGRLEHVLDVRDVRFKDDVRLMAPQANDTQVNNLENMLEAALALNIIYKIIRHYYILGKKTFSLYVIMQLQMVLPLIMREAEAYASALKAFKDGQPIGDGAGALVAAKLMRGHEKTQIAKDVVMVKVPIEGRTAYVLKAEGPGANVGKPGEAMKRIIEENDGKIALTIVVDAGLKLEGEKPGEVAEGIGVAIGGPGVEKYKVEEVALKHKVPVNAIIIKEDIGDAVSPMRKEISDAIDEAIQRIKRLILERSKEGDNVVIAGIGNTIGIGQ